MADAETPPISNEEALKLCKQSSDDTRDFLFQQTMYRIKDPRKTLPFYSEVLGMKLLTKLDFPAMKFSLYFMGYEDTDKINNELSSPERKEWALSRKATIELTHNWGTENDENFKYHNGNAEPKGYGSIIWATSLKRKRMPLGTSVVQIHTLVLRDVAQMVLLAEHTCPVELANQKMQGHIGILVPDVYKACERFETFGVNFIKRPDDGKMKGLAFITDPDGYWIEIFNNKNVSKQ